MQVERDEALMSGRRRPKVKPGKVLFALAQHDPELQSMLRKGRE